MELSLFDVAKLVRRWWWILVLGPLLAGVTAYLVSSALTPIYEAKATLLVNQSQTPGSVNYNDILAAQSLTQTYSRIVTSRPVLEAAASQLGGSVTVTQLEDEVSASPITNTQLITLSVDDPSPGRASAIADTVSRVFISQRKQQDAQTSGTSRDDLQRSADGVKQQIADVSSRISVLQQRPDKDTPENQAQLNTLQSQLAQYQNSYSTLLDALQRMDVSTAQSSAAIEVVEQAVVSDRPVRPRVMMNTAIAGVLGLFLAAGLALLLTYFDETIKSSEDVYRVTGNYALSVIGRLRAPSGRESLDDPYSPAAEAYRSLRTNLQFASMTTPFTKLVVTSVRPGEGKTTTSANLAIALAQSGQSVILVDADLRKPRLHSFFSGVSNRTGLTSWLLTVGKESERPDDYLQSTEIATLRILTSGPLPSMPSELVGSPRFTHVLNHLAGMADYIVIDTPPLAISDPLLVASAADGVVLVTKSGMLRGKDLLRAAEELRRIETPLLGVVVNQAEPKGDDYYTGYYGTTYGQKNAATNRRGLRRFLPFRRPRSGNAATTRSTFP